MEGGGGRISDESQKGKGEIMEKSKRVEILRGARQKLHPKLVGSGDVTITFTRGEAAQIRSAICGQMVKLDPDAFQVTLEGWQVGDTVVLRV